MTLLNIFDYTDYREYLLAIYSYRKATLPRYSYARMSEELDLGDRAFVQHILRGKKKLPLNGVAGIVVGLKLNSLESEYFTLLVKMTHAKSAEDKNGLWSEIRQYNQTQDNRSDLPGKRAELLEHWYAFTVKELLVLGCTDIQEIRSHFRFKISLKEISDIIDKLITWKCIAANSDGSYTDLDPEIGVPTESEFADIVRQHQNDALDLAKEALAIIQPEEREFQSITCPLSQKAFIDATRLIRETRDKLLSIYEDDIEEKSAVFQCNLNLFPIANC